MALEKLAVLAAALLLTACPKAEAPPPEAAPTPPVEEAAPPAEEKPAPLTDAEFTERSKHLIQGFAETLQGTLKGAMAKGGPAAAIDVCAEAAPEITEAASRNGLALKRIGVRVRNKKTNVPTEAERAILAGFTKEAPAKLVTDADGRRFYKAIYLENPVCLKCHGMKAELDPAVTAALAEKYPEDEAVDFAAGDLRGAFVVTEVGAATPAP